MLHLRREDCPRDLELKDSEERLPIRPLESGVSTADSQAVGFGGAFDRKVAGDQETECRVERVQLVARSPFTLNRPSPDCHRPTRIPGKTRKRKNGSNQRKWDAPDKQRQLSIRCSENFKASRSPIHNVSDTDRLAGRKERNHYVRN